MHLDPGGRDADHVDMARKLAALRWRGLAAVAPAAALLTFAPAAMPISAAGVTVNPPSVSVPDVPPVNAGPASGIVNGVGHTVNGAGDTASGTVNRALGS